MVAGHCCIRVHKMAMPLHQLGYEVNLILHRFPTQVDNCYKNIALFRTPEQLWEAIRAMEPETDIFHCHNEPNYLVSAVKETTDKPVILDWHDSFLLRRPETEEEKVRITVEERNNAYLADAHCFCNEPMQEVVTKEFEISTKPSCILWSYVPKTFYRWDMFRWIGGVCYEGRVDLPDIKKQKDYDFFTYCEYTEMAKALKEAGITFYLYPGKIEIVNYYREKELIDGGGIFDYANLIKKIGRHDWGLIGNLHSHREWEYAMPNKLFEYMAAQMPVIAINAGFAGEWIESEGIGINVKTIDEIKDQWDERDRCRNNVIRKRLSYCMENHIHKLEDLYGEVIHL